MSATLHDPAYRAFIDRIIELRRAEGVTQAALAARLHKPQSFVSKVERFERRIDPAEFCQIVEALNGDPAGQFAVIVRGNKRSKAST